MQAMNVEVWELWRIVCVIESLHNDIKFRNNLRVRGTAAHKKSPPLRQLRVPRVQDPENLNSSDNFSQRESGVASL